MDFEYVKINGGIKITKYVGAAESVTIPATVEDLPVTEIGKETFYGCDEIETVEIPNSVEKIGYAAFKYCSSLKELEIPDSVKVIAEDAFDGCENLILNISSEVKFGKILIKPKIIIQAAPPADSVDFDYTILENGVRIDAYTGTAISVTIPAKIENLPVTEIGNKTFSGCSSIKEIKIPDSVTEIGYKAFEGCRNLTEINIPNSVKKIGYKTFWSHSGLTKIHIPNSVTEIGAKAFQFCRRLTEINIPNSVTKICAAAFYDCRNLTEIKIPDSVTEIGDWAFADCKSLNLISLPAGIKISKDTFYNCSTKIIYRDKK